ncbi:dTMP kinase [Chitinivorax tropicus]|uniref:Thymidylate kinase n=1 Tax=Chitinivorax tropicus TaxID=714531 RepID=A0A840MMJ7_9PROT|nr:dTMP kinase [Chitinivorax tropicus]MBB5018695.1 dTMP kinase [Chitinivorax tropicus]
MPARFITLEGIDGAGKSTHLTWLTQWLARHAIDHIITREPGGTPLGEQLRALLLHEPMHLETEALLMFAGRREHLHQVIQPALAAGRWVVSDRFTDASFAYQGGGRGLSEAKLRELEHWIGGIQPDLTLLFDVPLAVSQARMASSRQLDRFEQEQSDFHARVRQAYLDRAHAYPQRFRIIDASRPIADIHAELTHLMETFIA